MMLTLYEASNKIMDFMEDQGYEMNGQDGAFIYSLLAKSATYEKPYGLVTEAVLEATKNNVLDIYKGATKCSTV